MKFEINGVIYESQNAAAIALGVTPVDLHGYKVVKSKIDETPQSPISSSIVEDQQKKINKLLKTIEELEKKVNIDSESKDDPFMSLAPLFQAYRQLRACSLYLTTWPALNLIQITDQDKYNTLKQKHEAANSDFHNALDTIDRWFDSMNYQRPIEEDHTEELIAAKPSKLISTADLRAKQSELLHQQIIGSGIGSDSDYYNNDDDANLE